ncbi:hypothetical protein BDF19DRAFT_453632 [Syncephalis fuscata]|nr:hypothetical protein BDF19DRAFT_453632 [Syncephalis fuscata]
MRLTDAALTNAIAISGLAQVKWRCITRPRPTTTTTTSRLNNADDTILTAYQQLLAAGVACYWRTVINTVNSAPLDNVDVKTDTMMEVDSIDKDATTTTTIHLEQQQQQHELWLFWWGQEEPALSLDIEQGVSRLGSFSWDAISSSAGAASRLAVHLASTLPEECDIFLEALRNLCTRGLAHRGIKSLGKYLILTEKDHRLSSSVSNQGLDGFRLHIHITASNALLLPKRCKLPIRSLQPSDLNEHVLDTRPHQYLSVKLSPFGIMGQVICNHAILRPIDGVVAEQQLLIWSTIHALPLSLLKSPIESNMPLFVIVRIGKKVMSYPTALVFPITTLKSDDSTVANPPLRLSIRDPSKSTAWSYTDHCSNLASAVLAQCAAHEPTPLTEESNDSDWKPVVVESDDTLEDTMAITIESNPNNENQILTQLCDLFQVNPLVTNEMAVTPSNTFNASVTTPNDPGVVTPAPTINTISGVGIGNGNTNTGDHTNNNNNNNNNNNEEERNSGLAALDSLTDFYNFDDPDTEMVTEDDFNFFDDGPVGGRSMESQPHASGLATETMTITDVFSNEILTAAAVAAVAATTTIPSNDRHPSVAAAVAPSSSSLLGNNTRQPEITTMDIESMNNELLHQPSGMNITELPGPIDNATMLLTPKDIQRHDNTVSPIATTPNIALPVTAAVCGMVGGIGTTTTALASPLSLSELRTALIPVDFAPLVDSTALVLDAKYNYGGRYAYITSDLTATELTSSNSNDQNEKKAPYTVDYEPSSHAKPPTILNRPVTGLNKSLVTAMKQTVNDHDNDDNDDDDDDNSSFTSSSDTDTDLDELDYIHLSDASQITCWLTPSNIDTEELTDVSSIDSSITNTGKILNRYDEAAWREFTWQALYSLNLHRLAADATDTSNTTLAEQGDDYYTVEMISQVAEKLFIQDASQLPPQRTHSTVRGQLSVKQLYELYESGQPQSKYGRYQVRKRTHKQGCIELVTEEPEVMVHQQEQALALSVAAIRFWEALRLEPYGGKKALIPIMVCPVGEAMETSARQLIKEVGAVYEACLLGTHRATNGLEVVPAILLPSMMGESIHDRQLRSLSAAFDKLGSQLPALSSSDATTIMIYVINPFSDHFHHLLALCQCFQSAVRAYQKRGFNAEQLAFQIVPFQLVNDPVQRATDHSSVCKALAFSAYARAFQRVPLIANHGLTFGCDYKQKPQGTAVPIYAPPYTIFSDALKKLELALPPNIHAPPLLRAGNLHVAYTGPFAGAWIACAWTDDNGEILESDLWLQTATTTESSVKQMVEQVWQRSRIIAERWIGGQCAVTIVRKGVMHSAEFKAWCAICGDDLPQVVLACTAEEPTLHIQLPTTENCSGEAPNSSIKSHTALAPDTNLQMKTAVGEVYLVDLGHRLAVSDEHSAKFIVSPHHQRQLLPLASGSLFWLPDADTLPEAGSRRLQVHLLRSPANVSANMTLRELLQRYYALSFLHFLPNFTWTPLPVHLRVLQQLVRLVECQSTL